TTVRRSAATADVPLLVFAKVATPTVTGKAKVGHKLTAAAGKWSPAPTRLSYQWYRGKTAIAGATGSGYTAQPADAGATLSVRVTGASTGYVAATKASKATSAVAKGDLTNTKAAITGKAKVGSTLTAVPGTWGPGGVGYGYRWYRGSTAIKGATGKTYKVTKKDRGAKLRVVVRGTKTGYVTVEKRASVRIAK
ncbi:MAG: carboxypeptidase regulatory-like domain-containing protein, partial [Propionibacterium sp.]|nr:carboxypeptidase regulatory-like domain-containing protein [Propionibacterium sp.]